MVRDELLRHRGLRGIVGGAERDVVHRAAAHPPAREVAGLAQIDDGAQRRVAAIARKRALARHFAEAEHIGEDRGGRLRVVDQQRHAMEAADRMLGRNVAVAPGFLVLGARHADQREAHAVGIAERAARSRRSASPAPHA